MNKKTKLALSIKRQFGCSDLEASEFANDVIASESQANGRIQPLQEIVEGIQIEDDVINKEIQIRMKLRIQHRGGVKI